MKSKWKVTSQFLGGRKIYQVYRQIDTEAVDHSGNRETLEKIYESKEEAQRAADELNGKEEKQ